MKNKFEKLFNSGYSIILQNVIKRINGEWESRIIWKHAQLPTNSYIGECRWEGFEDIEDCVDDCLTYLEKL
jgi:hypothetical protein